MDVCLDLQKLRAEHEVLCVPTFRVYHFSHNDSSRPSSSMANGVNAPRTRDISYTSKPDWDLLLREIRTAARDMHQIRKWRMDGRRNAAGWARWGAKQQVAERGEFVEEAEVGYEVPKKVDGQESSLKLGFRRKDAVVDDRDLHLG
jgi:hypothetical protein